MEIADYVKRLTQLDEDLKEPNPDIDAISRYEGWLIDQITRKDGAVSMKLKVLHRRLSQIDNTREANLVQSIIKDIDGTAVSLPHSETGAS